MGFLLRLSQLLPVGIRIRRLNHCYRSLQREVQHGFRGQLDLLTLGGGLHATTDSAACRRTDSCTFPATCNRANDGAEGSSATDLLSGILAARTALLLVLIGLNVVGPAS